MDRGTFRVAVAIAAVAALLAVAGAASAQSGQGGDRSAEEARHTQAVDQARQVGLFGTFTSDEAQGGQVQGDFSTFGIEPSSGNLAQYQVDWADRTLDIFDSVSVTVDGDPVIAERQGPSGPYVGWTSADGGAAMTAYDQPHGVLFQYEIGSDGGTITFDLAEGVSAELARSGDPARVTFTGSDEASPMCQDWASGSLSDVSVEEDTVTFTFDGEGRLIFTLGPPNATEEQLQLRRALDEAIVQGELASAEVTGVEGTPAQLVQPSQDGIVMARQAGDGYVRAEVAVGGSDDVSSPHPWHISIDRENLDTQEGEVAIRLDDNLISLTNNLQEVLDGSVEEPAPDGYHVVTQDTIEVVIAPNQAVSGSAHSMHTITIADEEARPNPWPPIRSENPIGSGSSLADAVRQAAADRAQDQEMIHDQTLQDGLDRAKQTGLLGALSQGPDRGSFVSADVSPSEGRISNLAVETGDGTVEVLSELSVSGGTFAEDKHSPYVSEDVTVDVADASGGPTTLTAGGEWAKVTLELPAGDDGEPRSTVRAAEGLLLVDYEDGVGILRETAGDIDIVPQGDTIELHLGANAGALFVWSPDNAAVEDGPWESTETGATWRSTDGGQSFVMGNTFVPMEPKVKTSQGGAAWAPVAWSDWSRSGSGGGSTIPGGWSDWSTADGESGSPVSWSDWAQGGGSAIPGGWSDWVDAGPQVGAEARLVAAGDQTVGSVTTGSVGVTPGEATETSVSATLDSNAPNTKFVGLLVPQEDLNGSAADEISVELDGRDLDSASPSDLRKGFVRGDAYAAADAGNAVHVLLQVEDWSEHDVTISGEGGGAGLGAPLGGGLAVVAGAGAALALAGRRRR